MIDTDKVNNVSDTTEVTWPQTFIGSDKDGNVVEVDTIADGKVQDTEYSEDESK